MRLAVADLVDGVACEIAGGRATVSWGDPKAPTVVQAETDGTHLMLFPDRSYRHRDLMKRLGMAVGDE